ncbi:hypothetical protein EJ02DRAFT_421947 [Clathrospora elynae]|uniref:Uncharacterized protein n=1 Tax=Clathrospora elynae TaxID=706981 RepID=A0A6A5SW28_9PLEO|nr:hypothetical protein EJ02DRAFT_421947 [Clathrospora elynae]
MAKYRGKKPRNTHTRKRGNNMGNHIEHAEPRQNLYVPAIKWGVGGDYTSQWLGYGYDYEPICYHSADYANGTYKFAPNFQSVGFSEESIQRQLGYNVVPQHQPQLYYQVRGGEGDGERDGRDGEEGFCYGGYGGCDRFPCPSHIGGLVKYTYDDHYHHSLSNDDIDVYYNYYSTPPSYLDQAYNLDHSRNSNSASPPYSNDTANTPKPSVHPRFISGYHHPLLKDKPREWWADKPLFTSFSFFSDSFSSLEEAEAADKVEPNTVHWDYVEGYHDPALEYQTRESYAAFYLELKGFEEEDGDGDGFGDADSEVWDAARYFAPYQHPPAPSTSSASATEAMVGIAGAMCT